MTEDEEKAMAVLEQQYHDVLILVVFGALLMVFCLICLFVGSPV